MSAPTRPDWSWSYTSPDLFIEDTTVWTATSYQVRLCTSNPLVFEDSPIGSSPGEHFTMTTPEENVTGAKLRWGMYPSIDGSWSEWGPLENP